MIVEYLKNQAARCMSLARVCFDLETARQLRLLGEDLKAKAEEIEGTARMQSRTMQQQKMQQQQQGSDASDQRGPDAGQQATDDDRA